MHIPRQTRFVTLPDGTVPHLRVRPGDVAPGVIFSGDPGRIELIKGYLDEARPVGQNRGFVVYTGSMNGVPVTIASHGVGAPSVSIVMEELALNGGRYFIRLGSGAATLPGIAVGQPLIATGAVRDEGTSPYYAPASYPAVADLEVTLALRQALSEVGGAYRCGVVRSTDSFYEGERKVELIEQWARLGVLAFEMEVSAIYCMAPALGVKAGSVIVPGANLVEGTSTYGGTGLEKYQAGMDRSIRACLRALALLHEGVPA